MFSAGLKLGVPFSELVDMHVPDLVMMLDSTIPMETGEKTGGTVAKEATRNATQ
jgi:hypothetical protein